MALTAIPLIQGIQLPNAVAVQYTTPSNSRVIVRHAVLTNTTAGAITATAYIVESGGSVTDARKILDAYNIPAHTAYTSPEFAGVTMNTGDTIQCFASAATSISVNISGILQT
jgi:hypothetical protein